MAGYRQSEHFSDQQPDAATADDVHSAGEVVRRSVTGSVDSAEQPVKEQSCRHA